MPYCSNCGALVYDAATRCQRCGVVLADFGDVTDGPIKLPLDPNVRLERWRRGRIILLLFAIGVLALLCLAYLLPFPK